MLSAQQISPLRVNQGGSVYVFGSGFDYKCKVLADNGTPSQIAELSVLDYGETWLEFSAPSAPGAYTVTIARDGYSFGEFSFTVVSLRNSETWNIAPRENVKRDETDFENEEFRNALLGLMPRGFAWFIGKMGNWWKLFSAFSLGFSAVYAVFRLLVDESNPAKTTSYEEWERELGLPIKGLEQSTDTRRLEEIFRVARKKGGATVPYFKSLAALFGLRAEVYEYWNPEHRSHFEGVDFGDDDPNFYWMIAVEGSAEDWHICTCNDTCNDYLQQWSNVPAEVMFEKLKPAHTKLLCSYVDVDVELVLVDNQDNVLIANNAPVVASVKSSQIKYTGTIELEDGTVVRTVRVKDLPDGGDVNSYMVRDSDTEGTVKSRAMDKQTLDELWDSTPAEREV